MKRIHLFEFEDQAWFPDWIRVLMTRYIMTFHKMLGTADLLLPLVEKGLRYTNDKVILDLCSGSGGPMIEVTQNLKKLPEHKNLKLILSDLYPNLSAADQFNNINPDIEYITTPLDASNVNQDLKGLRTMISSMHHMKPNVSRQILLNAKESNQPILIFEISDNGPPIFLWWLAIPFAFITTLFVTPMVRPMTWQQLVFTYIIPILPLFIAWDGAVSNARTYTLKDIDILIQGLSDENYQWEKGKIKGKGGNKVYLLGKPVNLNL
ncbi:hypothetical protein [Aquiflexum lacus]|uniref:hypothetical protein n=1 Tax=Aquiflexum lacus TaxID=2483805 RepID=UPI0018936D05|nr:hypothetical protein [Aquiflexum lacus]